MESTQRRAAPARDWRQPLAVGLAVGMAVPASRAVGSALERSLGQGWAFAAGLVAAAVMGAIVALALTWLLGTPTKARS